MKFDQDIIHNPEHSDKDDSAITGMRIGDLASRLGIADSTLRFWEKEFPYLKPERTDGGQRRYNDSQVQLAHLIFKLTRIQGVKLAKAREMIEQGDGGSGSADHNPDRALLRDIQHGLEAIRDRLMV